VTQVYADTFSNGYPTFSRFQKGFYCSICGRVTEHTEQHGQRICSKEFGGCGTSKPMRIVTEEMRQRSLLSVKLLKRYQNWIKHYAAKIEVDAINSVDSSFNFSICRWSEIQNKLHGQRSVPKLEKTSPNLYQMEKNVENIPRGTTRQLAKQVVACLRNCLTDVEAR
jgi:hypothetical protein